VTGLPVALFNLQTSGQEGSITRFSLLGENNVQTIIPFLLNDLREMKIRAVRFEVPEEQSDSFVNLGFQTDGTQLGLFGQINETIFMPILPLTNPTQKDLPTLAKLLHESYTKSPEANRFRDQLAAEKYLQDTLGGMNGDFLADASFISSTPARWEVVSACLIISSSPGTATVSEVFTHPLYRARGLATVEVQSAMNRLIKHGIRTLSACIPENHDVMRRLLTKLGMKQDRRIVRVSKLIP
jgi:GNAT superfamily N-acetyltransferase